MSCSTHRGRKAMFDIDPKNSTTARINEGIVQSDVEFRSGVKVSETLRFVRSDGLRMYIDVDQEDIPIAVEFVHPDGQNVEYKTIDEDDTESLSTAVTHLFAFASNMVFLHRAIGRAMSDFSTDAPTYMRQLGGPLLERMSGHILDIRPHKPDAVLAS